MTNTDRGYLTSYGRRSFLCLEVVNDIGETSSSRTAFAIDNTAGLKLHLI